MTAKRPAAGSRAGWQQAAADIMWAHLAGLAPRTVGSIERFPAELAAVRGPAPGA